MSVVNAVGIIVSFVIMYLTVTEPIPFRFHACEVTAEPTCSYFSRNDGTYIDLRIPILDHTTGRESNMTYITKAIWISIPCDPKPWFKVDDIPDIGQLRYCHYSKETRSMVFSAPTSVLYDMITFKVGLMFIAGLVGLFGAIYFTLRCTMGDNNVKISQD